MFKYRIFLFLTCAFLIPDKVVAQQSEIGISVTLSGHFIFGPYYRYWFDNNNEVDVMIPAAWEGKGRVLFPSGIQTGYHYYFGENHWRPSVGLQYSLFIGPKENGKRKNLNVVSFVPGIQYQWKDEKFSIEELFWISYLVINKNRKILPTGLETKFGVKIQ